MTDEKLAEAIAIIKVLAMKATLTSRTPGVKYICVLCGLRDGKHASRCTVGRAERFLKSVK